MLPADGTEDDDKLHASVPIERVDPPNGHSRQVRTSASRALKGPAGAEDPRDENDGSVTTCGRLRTLQEYINISTVFAATGSEK